MSSADPIEENRPCAATLSGLKFRGNAVHPGLGNPGLVDTIPLGLASIDALHSARESLLPDTQSSHDRLVYYVSLQAAEAASALSSVIEQELLAHQNARKEILQDFSSLLGKVRLGPRVPFSF